MSASQNQFVLRSVALFAVVFGAACAGDDAATLDGGGATTTVVMAGNAYEPAEVTVTVGREVSWTNNASATHTVTADDGESFDSGDLGEGDSFRHEFDEPGTYTYACRIHPFMHGTVVVSEPS